jgi:hypothetical protein
MTTQRRVVFLLASSRRHLDLLAGSFAKSQPIQRRRGAVIA